MEKVTDVAYKEMGLLIDDSINGERNTKEYFIIEMDKKEYLFSFVACSECYEKVCLLFAALTPIFHKEQNNFSTHELEKYLYGK